MIIIISPKVICPPPPFVPSRSNYILGNSFISNSLRVSLMSICFPMDLHDRKFLANVQQKNNQNTIVMRERKGGRALMGLMAGALRP